MTQGIHRIYIGIMVMITVLVTIYLSYIGYSFYALPIEERFYHARYDWFKPGGYYGHGLGIVGTLMILFGVVIYIVRKRYNFMHRLIRLKYLLEFHIFLCTLGPILVLFHTSFKFGGIVSIAFWSMVAVVLSGAVGRFIYIQIPRTIEGRELTLIEVKNMRTNLTEELKNDYRIDENTIELVRNAGEYSSLSINGYFQNRLFINRIKLNLKSKKIDRSERSKIIKSISEEVALSQRIYRLQTMQKLFKYWHVAHLPFALIMLIIVLIHVVVTVGLGYTWIF